MTKQRLSFDDIIEDYFQRRSEVDEAIEKVLSPNLTTDNLKNYFGPARYEYDTKAIQKTFADPVWELLERGGKRWRAILFLLIAEGFGADRSEFLEYATIPEILHTGTLIIDDIEDSGELRRGEPALHRIFGQDVALNAGNACYFTPLKIVSQNPADLSPTTRLRIYEMLMEELNRIHLGQAMDIYWHNNIGNVTEDQYFEMSACKTGGLARVAARIAAILTDQPESVEQQTAKYAETLAIAFQIGDDLLDLKYAMESGGQFGKAIGNDIKEGKMTLVIIHALKEADPEKAASLKEILRSDDIDEESVSEAMDIIAVTGSIEYARSKAREFSTRAVDYLDEIELEPKIHDYLSKFPRLVVDRDV